jgi:hypothetical protein
MGTVGTPSGSHSNASDGFRASTAKTDIDAKAFRQGLACDQSDEAAAFARSLFLSGVISRTEMKARQET